MSANTSIVSTSPDSVRLVTEPVLPTSSLEHGVHHRQQLVPGFDQAALTAATVNVIGLGVGSELTRLLIRKGVGRLRGFDPDPAVELSNLTRQFYYREQLYQPKALVLPHNLAREATDATTIEGYFLSFEAAVEGQRDTVCDVAVVAVDSNPTRRFCSQYFRACGTPCIFVGLSANADRAYVFVQEADGPCWGCLFPDQATDDTRFPCSAATIDLPAIVGGLIAYAVDSLLMPRVRHWNYREISLSGVVGDVSRRATPRSDCPLCGTMAATP